MAARPRAGRCGLALLAPLGLSFELVLTPHQLVAAAELARAFPDTALVLGHAGCQGRPATVKLSGLTQPHRTVAQERVEPPVRGPSTYRRSSRA